MTTTVRRGAGRPAATAKSNRHAQRTSLPPRPGVVEEALDSLSLGELRQLALDRGFSTGTKGGKREIIDLLRKYPNGPRGKRTADDAVPDADIEEMSVPELRKYARELRIEPMPGTRSGLLRAIRTAGTAPEPAGPRERVTPKAASPSAGRTAAATPQRTATGAPQKRAGMTKSDEKAYAYVSKIEELGWTTSVERHVPEGITEVTARRGDEILWISWTHGAMTNVPKPSYTVADRTVQIRNASECLKYAARARAEADQELEKVRTNRFFRRRPQEPKRSNLPFDPESASDRDIIDAIAGKTVHWHNSLTQGTEIAIMNLDPRRIEIEMSARDGERIVKFCCPHTGYRAFRLSALTKIGGGRMHSKKKAA